MKLAILGGSFNPVHLGHLSLAHDVHSLLGYDRILLIPANIPPHKEMEAGASSGDRLEMLRLAVRGIPFLEVDDSEISRGGISYTIDTLLHLETQYGVLLEGKVGLIIGEDLLEGFSSWKNADSIAARSDIIVAHRPGSLPFSFAFPCVRLQNSLVSVSSSEIRSALASSKSIRSLVPDAVYGYIEEHQLYER